MVKNCIDKIAVLDFGGQYAHLIANRIRRLGVYSEIVPCNVLSSELINYRGIVLSGSPWSVLDKKNPCFDLEILNLNVPVLGLCYGHQLLAKVLGGSISKANSREYGKAIMHIKAQSQILNGLKMKEQIWMSHGDSIDKLPDGFEVVGTTSNCPFAAVQNSQKKFFGLQFHPEVTDTPCGMTVLGNFLDICECDRNWNSKAYLEEIINEVRLTCKNKKVFLLVSGGVDSTVAFTLLNRALGSENVLGLHIDNGLMRYQESEAIKNFMTDNGYNNLVVYDASREFVSALKEIIDPEQKRNIIGNMFLTIKEKVFSELKLNAKEWILAQGTIYPDTIESAGTQHADRIKTHHNRVDLVLELIKEGKVIEPLSQLYKDEVRELGEVLDIPDELIWRHPFPGPGLGVRVLCSDGNEKIGFSKSEQNLLDFCIRNSGYKATVLPVRSVGVQGDERTFAHPVLISGKCNWEYLEKLSTTITNTVGGINRVIYGIKTGNPVYTATKTYITQQRLDKLRAVDKIVTDLLLKSGEYRTVWQMPVVLLPIINEAGDECVVLRPVMSQEAMTAQFMPLQQKTINTIVKQISGIKGIGDVFYDITHKPPATIEWE